MGRQPSPPRVRSRALTFLPSLPSSLPPSLPPSSLITHRTQTDGEEESKWEDNQARRESEVELRNVPRTSEGKHRDKSSYVLSFFLAGVSPLQALTYMSDASNYTYIHPYVQTVNIVERKREEEAGEDGGDEG